MTTWKGLVAVLIVLCASRSCLAIISLEYQIAGEDFYQNFMVSRAPLLIKKACAEWPVYTWFDDDVMMKEKLGDLKVQLIESGKTESKPALFSTILDTSRNVKFFYDVTAESSIIQQAITLPVMLVSCRALYYQFKHFGKAKIFGSISDDAVQESICFTNDVFIGLLRGEINVTFADNSSISMKKGDVLYIPDGSCIQSELNKFVVYVILKWKRVPDDPAMECDRSSMFDLVRFNEETDESPMYLDYSLPHITLNTGFKIPPLGLGTARLFEKTYKTMVAALEIGYRLFDTAQSYSGESNKEAFKVSSEHEMGRAIRDSGTNRSELYLVTKIHPDFKSRDDILKRVDQSLRELQTDYLDLLLIHDFDTKGSCKPEDADCKAGPWIGWRVLEELQSRNIARSIGVSNINRDDLEYLIRQFSKHKISVVQNWFDPFHQDHEVRSMCKMNNITYMGYSTLGTTWTDDDVGYDVNPVLNHAVIIEAAAATDLPVTSYVLRWAMTCDVIVIPCSSDLIHLETNFATNSQRIHISSESHMDKLDNALGNPDDEFWVKAEFSSEIINNKNIANAKDEL